MDVPRNQVVIAIGRVLSEKSDLDGVIQGFSSSLSAVQMGWFREVCSGVLRSKGRLDYVIDQHCLKKKPAGWTRRVLQVAVYQILFQDEVDSKLVVNETVSLIQEKEGVHPSRFANAVLRKISDHKKNWKELDKKTDAQWLSLPNWIDKEVRQKYKDVDLLRLGTALLERPFCFINWNPASNDRKKVEQKYLISETSFLDKTYYRFDQPSQVSEALKEFPAAFYVQDISSQKLVEEVNFKLLGNSDAKILDLCAAPGGKSIGLAFLGRKSYATDLPGSKRFHRLKENLSKYTGNSVTLLETRAQIQELGPYDCVWIDAPCSGSGIIRRHPEIRWNRTQEDLDNLRVVQIGLLREASQLVKKDGLLFYSVCSILTTEGAKQIDTILKELGNFSRSQNVEWLPGINSPGDGFYGQFLKRES